MNTQLLFFTEIFYKYIVLCKAKDIEKIYGGKMRRLVTLSVVLILLCALLTQNVFAGTEELSQAKSWYIVKRAGSAPSFPPEAETVKKYGGIYLDEKSIELGNKYIYLTFDAGYENGNITRIIDILNDCDVKASFFILSNLADRNKELLKKMVESGHLLCNHSSTHPDMTTVSTVEMLDELKRLEDYCYAETGLTVSKYFRFPQGKYTAEHLKALKEAGYKAVFWSLCYADWDNAKQVSPESAKKMLLSFTHDGAIVLLHPTSATNVMILRDLITEWKSMGYTFKTLENL